jgi:hypothetical protein
MPVRQQPCGRCGAAVVRARSRNGGWFDLEPYPDPDGRYEVVTRDGQLLVVGRVARAGGGRGVPVLSERGAKTYEPHSATCSTASVPRGGRPAQLDLLGEAE